MKVCYRWGGLLALGMMLLLLLSACGNSSTTTSQTTGTPATVKANGSVLDETPQQLLQSSITAMKQLKTTHFDMTTTTRTRGPSSQPGSGMDLKDSGDQLFPDKLSMQLTLSPMGFNQGINLTEVVMGQKVYIHSPSGKWYLLNDASAAARANSLAGANVTNYNNLLNLAAKSSLTDHGTEALNGMPVCHISASFNSLTLQDLLAAIGQFNGLSTQDRTKMVQALKNTSLEHPTLHLWIDETTFYVRRLELKFMMSVVNSAVKAGKMLNSANTPSFTSTSVDTTIDYSKFNVPVRVVAPTSAIATTNVSQIFQ